MSLSAFAQEGLLRVVRLLESLPDDQFNLSSWHNQKHCGTTYCAMGYAASTDWFRQRGLSLDGNGGICLKRANERPEDGFYAVGEYTDDQDRYAAMVAASSSRARAISHRTEG